MKLATLTRVRMTHSWLIFKRFTVWWFLYYVRFSGSFHANGISFSGLSLALNASRWEWILILIYLIACCALAMSYCSQFVDPEIIHLPLFNFPQSHFNLKTEVRYALGLFDIRFGFLLSRPGNPHGLSIDCMVGKKLDKGQLIYSFDQMILRI